MTNPADNPHDRYFKEAFSQIDILADFLNVYLPDELREQLDFSSLVREQDSYTDESLSEHFADLIFTARLGTQPVRIALLLEHKSYTESHIHFQLNRYMLNAWEDQLSHKKPLLPIIPIIIYHGRRRWKKWPIPDYFGLLPTSVLPYVPSFDYVLIDLSTILERLPAFASDYAKLTGVLLQNSRQKRLLERALREIGDSINRLLAEDRGERFFKTSLLYLTWVTSLTKGEAVIIFRTVSEQAENYNMSLYEQLIQEGVEKGREEGREQAVRAMLKLKVDAAAIAAALDYPLDRVLAIVEQVEAERK